VPTLIDGPVTVWESLAIMEYLAEKFPDRKLWPEAPAARAHARTVSAEMHAGFQPLRQACPMNMRRAPKPIALSDEVRASVARVEALWADCRVRYGEGGPFLFGSFGAADAMYAPVVSRFHTYAIPVGPEARRYMEAIMALPAWAEWLAAARAERWIRAKDEVP
jgi:glutathione S-transferase